MADYNAKYLTNYFSVTDEAKFKNLMKSCHAQDEIEIYEKEQPDGAVKYSFGCLGIIDGISEDNEDNDEGDEDIGLFYSSLQTIIPPGEAVIITEIGNEKLNYLIACCTVITCAGIKNIDARDEAVKLAAVMLNKPDFITQMDY